jgi:hypothetical protein
VTTVTFRESADFYAGDLKLSAGDYVVSRSQLPLELLLSKAGWQTEISLKVIPISSPVVRTQVEIVFKNYAGTDYLSEILIPGVDGSTTRYSIVPSSAELLDAKHTSPSEHSITGKNAVDEPPATQNTNEPERGSYGALCYAMGKVCIMMVALPDGSPCICYFAPDNILPGFVFGATSRSSSSVDVPEFPWPPPVASSTEVIPTSTLKMISKSGTMKDLDAILVSALTKNGYSERSYYAVPGGFVLVTRLEQIESNGKPMSMPARWSAQTSLSSNHFSMIDYLRALLKAPPGYYRVIAFVVTPTPFAERSKSVSESEVSAWQQKDENPPRTKRSLKGSTLNSRKEQCAVGSLRKT